MSRYAIEFVLTPSQIETLLTIPGMSDMFDTAIRNGIMPTWDEEFGGTAYRFRPKGAALVPDGVIAAVIGVEGLAVIAGGIWVEVPTSTVDNLVPVNWPFSRMPIDEEGVSGERRAYEDCTTVIKGTNGASLLRVGMMLPGSNNYITDNIETPEMIALYASEFTSPWIYRGALTEWKANNTQEDDA